MKLYLKQPLAVTLQSGETRSFYPVDGRVDVPKNIMQELLSHPCGEFSLVADQPDDAPVTTPPAAPAPLVEVPATDSKSDSGKGVSSGDK